VRVFLIESESSTSFSLLGTKFLDSESSHCCVVQLANTMSMFTLYYGGLYDTPQQVICDYADLWRRWQALNVSERVT